MWAVVRAIPRGRVLSYAEVAERAGYPRAARFVGQALRVAKGTLPWHRVLGHDGRIRIMDPGLRRMQIERLRSEGVAVSDAGKVAYRRWRWPAAAARARSPGSEKIRYRKKKRRAPSKARAEP
jgi:methylated-DNA-protein-cysteine methyltransferase-like protein